MPNDGLNYEDTGDGTQLVLLHGFPFDHMIWQAQLDGLSDTARILTPDLPGFGASAPLDNEPSMDAYADAVASWAEQIGLERFVLAGHSMGGYITFAFVRRHPEMLSGLVLVSTRPGADSDVARENRLKQASEVKQRGPQVIVDAMLPKLLAPEHDPALEDAVRQLTLRQSNEGIIAALRAMAARPDSTSTLEDIIVPTLVIAGSEDAIIPPTEGESMAGHIRGAGLVEVKRTGHLPMMEAPADFNQALREFLMAAE
jgi:3-oxoadipate enol-lactonase